jgi:ABC-2 type transport system ATP-binding protein
MSDVERVVETRDLTKYYGTHRALDGLTLQVPKGSVFGLLGQNGAGKSTTIRLLLGLIRPSQGEVLLFGEPLAEARMKLLARVGCLVEGPAFYPYLSGEANLRSLGELCGEIEKGRVQAVLERVGLGDRGGDRYRGYSTGMRQRLGLAAALLHDPELVILDEPMSGLDPPAVVMVRNLIRELADSGKTVVVSSHMLSEVELACDQVAIINKGQVVAQGAVSDLIRPSGARVDVKTDAPERAAELAGALPYVTSATPGVDGVVTILLSEDRPAELNSALVDGGVAVSALIPHKRTLEDLFHELAAKA